MRPQPDAEEGRVSLLMLLVLVIVLSLVLVGAAVSALEVQRMRLLSCADTVANAAAQVGDADAFYRGGASDRLPIHVVGATQRAEATLSRARQANCRVGEGVTLQSVNIEGGDVVVRVTTQAVIPVFPEIVGDVVAPRLDITAAARLY